MRKEQVDKALSESEKELEFKAKGNKKYEVEVIIKYAIYG